MNSNPQALVRIVWTTLVLAAPAAAVAQEYPYDVDTKPRRGFLTDTMTGVGVDSIDSVGGHLRLDIPIASMAPGPAGSGFDLSLIYNSSIWQARPAQDTAFSFDDSYEVMSVSLEADAGWRYNYKGYGLEYEERIVLDDPDSQAFCPIDDAWRHRFRIGLPDGSLHTLFLLNEDNAEDTVWDGEGFLIYDENGLPHTSTCATPENNLVTQRLTYYTVDGSYLKVEIEADGANSPTAHAEWILHYPDGRRVHGKHRKVDRIYDANGNWVEFVSEDCVSEICITVIRDQYHQQVPGREIRIRHDRANSYDEIMVPTESGTATWTVNWGTVTVESTEAYPLKYEHYPGNSSYQGLDYSPSGMHRVVQSIDLPVTGAGSYVFDYDHDGNHTNSVEQYRWGELTRMITPTGAVYDYVYRDALRRAPRNLLRNAVEKKVVTAGTDVRTWTYAYDRVASTTTITGPDGGETVFAYKDPNYPWSLDDSLNRVGNWDRGLIHTITNPDGSVIARTWKRNKVPLAANWDSNPNNPYVEREEFTLSGTGAAVKAVTDFTYDKNGNLLSRIEKNWDGTQARKLVQTFHHEAPADEADSATVNDDSSGYWRPHATPWTDFDEPRRLNAVERREIWGTGTTPKAVSEFAYDDPYRSGNVTKEVRWDNVQPASATTPLNEGLSQVLVRGRHPSANGNLTSISAPEIPTVVTYDRLGALSSPYPTRVTYGTGSDQRVFSYEWNYKTGNLISWTDDDNSVTTSYLYDGLGRRTSESQAGLRKTITA